MKLTGFSASHPHVIKSVLAAFGVVNLISVSLVYSRAINRAPAAEQYASRPVAVAAQASMDRFVKAEMGRADGVTSLIVQLRSEDDGLSNARRQQLVALEASVARELPIVHSIAVRLPRRNLPALATAEWVSHLSLDGTVEKTDEFTTIASGAVAASARYNVTGSGVTVAVVDSGIYPSDDLKATTSSSGGRLRVSATVDYVDEGSTNLKDANGHGTHVAGVIAGNGLMSSGSKYYRTFNGIAPKANLVNVRVLDQMGHGDVSTVIAGLQWIIQNKAAYNIRVVNLSLGHAVGESYTTDPLCQAVEQVWKAGIVVVCSAGNDGRQQGASAFTFENSGYGTNYGSIRSPGNSPYVITVGATRRANMGILPYRSEMRFLDQIASYSSRGPSSGDLVLKPDIIAPGDRVISVQASNGLLQEAVPGNQVWEMAYQLGKFGRSYSQDYYVLSGTSIAAPVVAGAAALMLEKDPTLTPDTIKARLMVTADKWVGRDRQPDVFTYGAGYLNVAAAMKSTITVEGYALSPFVGLETDGTLRIGDQASVWQNGSFWGTGITNLHDIWGNAVYTNVVFDPFKKYSAETSQVQGDVFMWGGGSIKRSADTIDSTTLSGDQ